MISARYFRRTILRTLLGITFFLILFNEFFVYQIHKTYWTKIECRTDNCTRILFVADPQILGNEFDKSIYSGLARFDSDWYLRNTFKTAVEFSKPNIIIFLGDLLDEGSVASYEQFRTYSERFHGIFSLGTTNGKHIESIHIPGDNDIGGENGEYISNSNKRRFNIEFTNGDLKTYKNSISFYKINRMQLEFFNTKPKTRNDENQQLRIGISHMPLLSAGGTFLQKIFKQIDPHILFTAHWHNSKLFVYPSSGPINLNKTNFIINYDLKDLKMKKHEYLEIMVPTCSYRMGTWNIGYGLAVLDDFHLQYTVLWTISRFVFLHVYLVWLILLIAIILLLRYGCKCLGLFFRHRIFVYRRVPHF